MIRASTNSRINREAPRPAGARNGYRDRSTPRFWRAWWNRQLGITAQFGAEKATEMSYNSASIGGPLMFEALDPKPADSLLALISLSSADHRPYKINLGIGVFRDENGLTPIMRTVKAAEQILLREQASKSYLGIEGDRDFVDLLRPVIFGTQSNQDNVVGFQTPGGSGALRLGADLIAGAKPSARVWLGSPSWPNHRSIFEAAHLSVRDYCYAHPFEAKPSFEIMMSALATARQGDVVLLHGCCHNPTGLDLDDSQWRALQSLCNRHGLIPFVDMAYHGLGQSLEQDATGLRCMFDGCEEALVAYSCDKNFGLYRERVGALYVKSRTSSTVASHIASHARVSWSMPPDHGAAIVRTILERDQFRADWHAELSSMAARIQNIRNAVAERDPALRFIAHQRGLFSTLLIRPEQVDLLRSEHAVYVTPSGRVNLAGLRTKDVCRFVCALRAVGFLNSAMVRKQTNAES